jgi:hypothetical protein
MRKELIYLAVQAPDPIFVSEMLQMPDPKSEDEERVIKALAELHVFFLRKKEAYKQRNAIDFHKILDEEIRFLQDFDSLSLRY